MTAPGARAGPDRRAQVVADDRAVPHLAEDVDDHDVPELEGLDDPGVLAADRREPVRLAGDLDRVVQIGTVRQELRGHRPAHGDPAGMGLEPATLELARRSRVPGGRPTPPRWSRAASARADRRAPAADHPRSARTDSGPSSPSDRRWWAGRARRSSSVSGQGPSAGPAPRDLNTDVFARYDAARRTWGRDRCLPCRFGLTTTADRIWSVAVPSPSSQQASHLPAPCSVLANLADVSFPHACGAKVPFPSSCPEVRRAVSGSRPGHPRGVA